MRGALALKSVMLWCLFCIAPRTLSMLDAGYFSVFAHLGFSFDLLTDRIERLHVQVPILNEWEWFSAVRIDVRSSRALVRLAKPITSSFYV